MASVYELDQSLDKFFELLEDGEITDDVLLDVWNNLEDDIKSKFENCCKWMVNVKATIAAIKEQKKDTVEIIYSTGFDGETTVDAPEDYFKPF